MSASMTRKRKAEIFVQENDRKASKTEARSGQPHLPPPVWGHVLDYMPYQEVRSALHICKSIANEAVRYVNTLNIMRDCELDIPAARRFPHVEHVNVLCLIKEDEDSQEWNDQTISSCITPIATVPFIQMFPRLSSIFVGGFIGGEKELYSHHSCIGERHAVLFRSLISSFIGAYRTRALSQELSLLGVVRCGYLDSTTRQCELEREEGDSRNECQWCRNACKYLPLQDHELFRSGELCLDDETRDGILVGRKGGPNAILMVKAIKIVELISESVHWHYLDLSVKDDRELKNKIIDMGLNQDKMEGDPQYLNSDDLEEVDGLVRSLRIKPRDIPKELFYKKMSFGVDGRQWDIYCKSTVDSLIARGYPIDPNDLIVVDETQEPALQRIIQEKGSA